MIVMKLSLKRKKQGRKVEAGKLSLSIATRPRCAKTGKVIWDNKATAKHQAEAYRRSKGAKMGAYSCESCQGWHIGHMLYHKRKNKAKEKSWNIWDITEKQTQSTVEFIEQLNPVSSYGQTPVSNVENSVSLTDTMKIIPNP